MAEDVAAAWNAEYASGRYTGEPPVPFVYDIVAAAREARVAGEEGLYIGCGNGRNYVPLVAAGLNLQGIDISSVAISQLRAKCPACRHKLVLGDLSSLSPEARYALVIGIQIFQHGSRSEAHELVEQALDRVSANGLFAVRVNAVGTDVEHAHEVIERHADGPYTILYTAGPKTGLAVHFWAAIELHSIISKVLPCRHSRSDRRRPGGSHCIADSGCNGKEFIPVRSVRWADGCLL